MTGESGQEIYWRTGEFATRPDAALGVASTPFVTGTTYHALEMVKFAPVSR